jgi:hypothetical protein
MVGFRGHLVRLKYSSGYSVVVSMTASEGKNGNWYFHCGDCGRFLSVGDPKPIVEGMGFDDQPRFPDSAPEGIAGEPIRSVADAICAVHGVVEEGAFWSTAQTSFPHTGHLNQAKA